ncbi:MAG: hypothetical protein HY822_20605 [Acidobacteria bacterium]|nr:hypothetical protein [Acidobacteriota bacterium]
MTEINSRIAVRKEAGTVCYVHGLLPVFRHDEADVRSFRMFTSQIAGGTVKPKEIVKTFGVPMITVKRYVKLYRECGAKGFFEAKPRRSSASVLKGEVLKQAQRMLDEGRSLPEVAAELGVLRNTLAVRAGRLRGGQPGADGQRRNALPGTSGGGDGGAGVGADRVSSGLRRSAGFRAVGIAGAVGGGSAALCEAPGEWGKLLGLDRIPEVRTLRAKLKLLCRDLGPVIEWHAELAKEWVARQNVSQSHS